MIVFCNTQYAKAVHWSIHRLNSWLKRDGDHSAYTNKRFGQFIYIHVGISSVEYVCKNRYSVIFFFSLFLLKSDSPTYGTSNEKVQQLPGTKALEKLSASHAPHAPYAPVTPVYLVKVIPPNRTPPVPKPQKSAPHRHNTIKNHTTEPRSSPPPLLSEEPPSPSPPLLAPPRHQVNSVGYVHLCGREL